MKWLSKLFFLLILLSFINCEDDPEIPDSPSGWESLGLNDINVHKIQFSENYLFAATDQGMFRQSSTDISSTNWISVGLEGKEVIDFILFNDQEILAATDASPDEEVSLFKTTDGGSSWIPFQNGFGGDIEVTAHALAHDPTNASILFARAAYAVAKSTDRGESWVPVFGEWGSAGYQAPLIQVDENFPDHVWAGGESSIFQPYLWKSTNGGESWLLLDLPYEGDNSVYTLASHPENRENILIGMEGQILSSSDGGENWQKALQIEDGTYIIDLENHPEIPQKVYGTGSKGGTSGGNLFFYSSDDFGSTWELMVNEDNPGTFFAHDLELKVSGNQVFLYIATDRGLYRFVGE